MNKKSKKIVYTCKGKSIEENNNEKLSKRFFITIVIPKQTDSELFEYMSHLQDFEYQKKFLLFYLHLLMKFHNFDLRYIRLFHLCYIRFQLFCICYNR